MPRNEIVSDVRAVEDWYKDRVRPFLERIGKIGDKAGRVDDFDAELDRLQQVRAAYDDELVVCFLGAAGVGKSTLINALIDGRRPTLPHGGIGPLTAQALSVRKGTPPGLRASYHSRGQVWKLATALEWGFKDQLAGGGPPADDPPAELAQDPALNPEAIEEILDTAAVGGRGDRSRVEAFRKQANLLIKGSQEAEAALGYLVDALRSALGMGPKWGHDVEEADRGRVDRIRDALAAGKAELAGSVSDNSFKATLEDHATGFLAPLIAEMSVVCESETLPDGVVLVDLPGLGVAGDIHKEVTSRWLRDRARAVVLVVGNRGIQDADAQLLQESGFLNRLVYSAESPSDDPADLLVAVVRVDEIAESRVEAADLDGEQDKQPPEFFAEVCEESRRLVIAQLRPQLEKAWSSGQVQEAQARVIDNLLGRLEVHPVSALEYRSCYVRNSRRQPLLGQPGLTNIPDLLDALRGRARERREAEVRRLEEVCQGFQARLDATLAVIHAQWLEDSRASEEAERLREEFLGFVDPLRGEYRSRQGAYREFIRETLPQAIRSEVEKASRVARKEIDAYLRQLEDVGWKTLQATVQRGGTFVSGVGRQINLPNDFALRFEVPVADAWAKRVLKEVRRRTREFAEDSVELVDRVVEWAQAQGTRIQPRLVEAQRDAIKADMKALETVGRIMVDQLRRDVNSRLIKQVEVPIRKRCGKFIDRGDHAGAGAKRRILDLFETLAGEVTEAAIEPAEGVLTEAFRKVQDEILAVLKKHPDPLDAARDAIVDAHENYVRRSDAQRRRQVLAEIHDVLASRHASSPAIDGDGIAPAPADQESAG